MLVRPRFGAILVALFVVGTGIAGIVWWSLHSLGEQPGSKVIATTQGTGLGVYMADLLSSAPTGTGIPAANPAQSNQRPQHSRSLSNRPPT